MEKKDIIPKIRKKVSSFLTEEIGAISKQSVVSIGALIATIAASNILSSKDVEAAVITITSSDDGTSVSVTGSHSHHSNHAAHATHATHDTHATHSSSDFRLKQNLQRIQNPLEKIQKIHGISFEWKEGKEKSIGLIAQEVEKVFPELVFTDEATGLKSVQYGNLIAPLIEAIKEQQIQIKNLQIEILNLKKETLQH